LNDNSIEGLEHKILPVFSVQFHPEGAPGPTDTEYLFDKFISIMRKTQVAAVAVTTEVTAEAEAEAV
jgi:carbamoyl-phosphate synthase small subunit